MKKRSALGCEFLLAEMAIESDLHHQDAGYIRQITARRHLNLNLFKQTGPFCLGDVAHILIAQLFYQAHLQKFITLVRGQRWVGV